MFEGSDLRLLAAVAHIVTGLAVLVVWIGIPESLAFKDFWLQPNDVNVIFLRGHFFIIRGITNLIIPFPRFQIIYSIGAAIVHCSRVPESGCQELPTSIHRLKEIESNRTMP